MTTFIARCQFVVTFCTIALLAFAPAQAVTVDPGQTVTVAPATWPYNEFFIPPNSISSNAITFTSGGLSGTFWSTVNRNPDGTLQFSYALTDIGGAFAGSLTPASALLIPMPGYETADVTTFAVDPAIAPSTQTITRTADSLSLAGFAQVNDTSRKAAITFTINTNTRDFALRTIQVDLDGVPGGPAAFVPAAISVPEPASLGLLFTAIAAFSFRYCRR